MSTARALARKARIGRVRRVLSPTLRRLTEEIDARRPPRIRTIEYRGHHVVYSRGTSLIQRIRNGGSYEPDLVDAIVARLREAAAPTVVDVGANIGLVTLGIVAALPSVRVYAFEPGPHAASLLRQTLVRNGLEETVSLVEAAVGDENGTATFSTHGTRHASGDGFHDTGRAGRSTATSVRTLRLDTWWREAGRPHVDVLKVDVEGAELLVFSGASELLAVARPTIFFELHPVNLAAYPYDAGEVVGQLADAGYRVSTLTGAETVDAGNVDNVIRRRTDMVAEPVA